jgi:hypothetical protein
MDDGGFAEVDDQRNPGTNATVSQLLERYLGVLEIEDTTRSGYESMIRLYIRPLLGDLAIGRIDGETVDAFYAELRRCGQASGVRTGPQAVENDRQVPPPCTGAHRLGVEVCVAGTVPRPAATSAGANLGGTRLVRVAKVASVIGRAG